MNRIRKINNHYEVLITPHDQTEAESEYLLSQWLSEDVDNYDIKTFNNYEDAYEESSKYPNINWAFFYLYYVDTFHFLKDNIFDVIRIFSIFNDSTGRKTLAEKPVRLQYNLMSDKLIKENFFNRVYNKKRLFRPLYDFSDILSFKIICNNINILNEIKRIIPFNRIFKIIKIIPISNNNVKLIGCTTIGTTYQIILTI